MISRTLSRFQLKNFYRNGAGFCSPSLQINHLNMRLMSSDINQQFEKAKKKLDSLKNDPGNEVKLKIYALFKQAVVGKNDTAQPSSFNFVAKAKWSAWSSLGDMTQDQAKSEYVKLIAGLVKAESGDTSSETSETSSNFKNLVVTQQDGYTKILLNRPTRKNAITVEMYEEIILALKQAGEDKSTFTVFTGAGDYYCSGNDLSNFMAIDPSKMKEAAKTSGDLLRRYVEAYINFPKPLIAAVNGPAIGVSVTVLGLFDTIYASDQATFSTPFSKLGQSPEGCSSHTFPKIMGHAKACEMMLFNRKLSAEEALACGLVTRLFPHASFQADVEKQLKEMATLPVKSLIYSKALMRDPERDLLHRVNVAECDRLVERWPSEDCVNAVMKFFQEKQK